MSIFFRRSRKSAKPKSLLRIEVEEISSKVDEVLAILSQPSRPAGQQQQPAQQPEPQTPHDGFEPFSQPEPFSPMEQEGGDTNG